MRVGATIFVQNYKDWDRYEAEERGQAAPTRPTTSDRSIFLEEINIARIADETGFDSVWTVEHHFTPYTMITNPLQFLTYLAGITQHVDLGTMVVVLPWHNPVRVAEDVNMLDALLGPEREIICGVGRGLGRREYNGMCVNQANARELFDESLQILQQLLATGSCSFEGKHYQLKDVRLRPQPEGDLSANLYCAGGTAETVQIIAQHNVRPLIIPTTSLETALQNAQGYMQLRYKAGHAPSDTKLALWTYCAETQSEAQAGAERYMVEYADSALRHYELLRGHLGGIQGYESYGTLSDALRKDGDIFRRAFFKEHPWGTPDQVIAKTKRLAEAFGTSEIMFIFKYGGMPMKAAEKSMQLFAREVMPALKDLNPKPMQLINV
jgi:alkanesulfonate monooxygenase SsuD/methylene tetrahydromethanopterin reductase-like flavin-dependent oxidoreductase (luciferase family)